MNIQIKDIIENACNLQAVSTEEHPCEAATDYDVNNFRAVGAAREALSGADLIVDESVFENCCERECAAEILESYFEDLGEAPPLPRLINQNPDCAFHSVIAEEHHKFLVPVARQLDSDYVNVCDHSADFENSGFVAALYTFEDEFLGFVIVRCGPANIRRFKAAPEGYFPGVEWDYDTAKDYAGRVMHTTDGNNRPVFVDPETGLTWREDTNTSDYLAALLGFTGQTHFTSFNGITRDEVERGVVRKASEVDESEFGPVDLGPCNQVWKEGC